MFDEMIEDSWVVQEWMHKGIEKGIKKGIEQGELKALRSTLINFVETRYPELTGLAQQQAERIIIPELLMTLNNKLFAALTVDKARQVLMEIDQVPNTPHPDL